MKANPLDDAFYFLQPAVDEANLSHLSPSQLDTLFDMVRSYVAHKALADEAEVRQDAPPQTNKRCRSDPIEGSNNDEHIQEGKRERLIQEKKLLQFATSLNRVRSSLRQLVPPQYIHSEKIIRPSNSLTFTTSTASSPPCFDVDAFLYGEDDIDELCHQGILSRYYCTSCSNWKSIGLSEFISHSFSRDQLIFVFLYVLPFLVDRCNTAGQFDAAEILEHNGSLVDVGSRLGIVLFSALFSTSLRNIIGLESNEWFVSISKKIHTQIVSHSSSRVVGNRSRAGKQKHLEGKSERVVILHEDALSPSGLEHIASANLLVMHNVFEWFSKEEEQVGMWTKIKEATMRRLEGVHPMYIISSPSLETSLAGVFLVGQPEESRTRAATAFLSDWVVKVEVGAALNRYSQERVYLSCNEVHKGGETCSGSDDSDDKDETLQLCSVIHVYEVIREGKK